MYKTVIRSIHAGATVYDQNTGDLLVQNASECDMYLSEAYPTTKYNLVAVNALGESDMPNGQKALRFSWHFVEISKK
jgi:hypothetical protein